MKVIFLGIGYLGYNLFQQMQSDFQCEMWGIPSIYSEKLNEYKQVDLFCKEDLEHVDCTDAIVVDTTGLVRNNAISDEEDAFLSSIVKAYQTLLLQLKEKGMRQFVFLSSGGTVYGNQNQPHKETDSLDPQTLYAKSKVALEKMIQESNVPYLILRLANPYGGYQDAQKKQGVIPILIRCALKQQPFTMWGSEESKRDYLYIDDFAKILKGLLIKGYQNEIFNVGSGKGTSLRDLIEQIEKETGKSIQIQKEEFDVQVIDENVLDIEKLKKALEIDTFVSVEEGIKYEVERLRQEEEA